MTQSQMSGVKKVVELRLPEDAVNEYLEKGWVLLNVFAESVASDHGPSQRPVYVVGWTGKGKAPK